MIRLTKKERKRIYLIDRALLDMEVELFIEAQIYAGLKFNLI